MIGAVLTIYFYFTGKRDPAPRTARTSVEVLTEETLKGIARLAVWHGDTRVETLTLTRISLWNRGRGIINSSDIADRDPLRVERGDAECGRILSANLSYVSSEANAIDVRLDENQDVVFVAFDFLARNDGCIIEVLHDGPASLDLALRGTIKGAPVRQGHDTEVTEAAMRALVGWWLEPLKERLPKSFEPVLATVLLLPLMAIILALLPLTLVDRLATFLRRGEKRYYLAR